MKQIPFSNPGHNETGVLSGNGFIIQRVNELLASFRNVVLMSPRGWQLKDLVCTLGKRMQSENQNLRICHLDLKLVATRTAFEKMIFEGISSLSRPEDRYRIRRAINPSSILSLPGRFAEETGSNVLVFINNFHNILRFDPNGELQKSLRWHWRSQKNHAFCIYGENLKLYQQIFRKPRCPLIAFGKFYYMARIDTNALTEHIVTEFENGGKNIERSLARSITQITGDHPFYARVLARETWFRTINHCTEEIMQTALESILDQNSLHYMRMTDRLTNIQMRFLKALICEETRLCSADTISRYQLGTSAHVARCRQNLERHEVIINDRWQVRFTDPLYKIWLKSRYFELPDPFH